MATGGLAVGLGFIFGGWLPLVAQAVAGIAWLFLAYMRAAVNFTGELPYASLILADFHPVWLFLYYLGLALVIWWWRVARTGNELSYRIVSLLASKALLGGLAVLAVGIWIAAFLV